MCCPGSEFLSGLLERKLLYCTYYITYTTPHTLESSYLVRGKKMFSTRPSHQVSEEPAVQVPAFHCFLDISHCKDKTAACHLSHHTNTGDRACSSDPQPLLPLCPEPGESMMAVHSRARAWLPLSSRVCCGLDDFPPADALLFPAS